MWDSSRWQKHLSFTGSTPSGSRNIRPRLAGLTTADWSNTDSAAASMRVQLHAQNMSALGYCSINIRTGGGQRSLKTKLCIWLLMSFKEREKVCKWAESTSEEDARERRSRELVSEWERGSGDERTQRVTERTETLMANSFIAVAFFSRNK